MTLRVPIDDVTEMHAFYSSGAALFMIGPGGRG